MAHTPTHRPFGHRRLGRRAAIAAAAGLAITGLATWGPSAGATGAPPANGGTLKVALVANPQMEDIANLTPELFTADTGINVNYTVLDEGTLREVTTRDVGAGGQQFDVVMIGMYEAPQFGTNGWLVDLTPYATDDASYNIDDLIPAVRAGLSVGDSMYASPFYAESSFLMYRKDVLDAAGIEMPAKPTWDRWPTSPARSTPTTWPASACAASPDGETSACRSRPCSTRSAAHGGRRTPTARSAKRRSTSPSSRKRCSSTSTSWPMPARTTPPTLRTTSARPCTATGRWRCGTTPRLPRARWRPTTAQ